MISVGIILEYCLLDIYLGVDDERRVPWIATALGPDEVERLKGDVHRRHARVVLVTARITIELKFFSENIALQWRAILIITEVSNDLIWNFLKGQSGGIY